MLLVDDEEDLRWSIVRHFANDRPDLAFLDTGDPREALDHLSSSEVDVLVTDFKMPHMSGLELLLEARRIQPDLPIIFITAFGSPEIREEVARRGAFEFLEKPFATPALLGAIERALAASAGGFKGSVQLTLPDLLQLYAFNQSTGMLTVKLKRRQGAIWFKAGRVIRAECGKLRDAEAVTELLGWSGGSFQMDERSPLPSASMNASCDELLLETFRLMDEGLAHPGADPAQEPPSPTPGPATGPASPRSDTMANVKESLGKLAEVDGFIAGCLVDSGSGMVLGTVGGGPAFNIETAAAGNTEVVRSKRKTMKALGLADRIEDILITLGSQYHLIRPLANNDGLFLYVALDRTKSNLALARQFLAGLENGLVVA